MDGLHPGSRSAHSHDSSHHHSRHRGYVPSDAGSLLSSSMPFMMPSYPAMMALPGSTQPSCAEVGGLPLSAYRHSSDRSRTASYAVNDGSYKSSSYHGGSSSSSSRHSPARSSVTASLSSSSDHRSSVTQQHRSSSSHSSGVHYATTTAASQATNMTSADVQNFAHCHEPQQAAQVAPAQPAPKQSNTTSTTQEPPKKPLSPYMRFSKSIWFQVKAANPQLSVCQLGAMIGRMWRELSEEEKKRHLDDFHQDKVRYDNEVKRYLKTTGLRAKDLKAIVRTQPKSKKSHHSSSSKQSNSQQPSTIVTSIASTSTAANTNTQLAAAQAASFMGLPLANMPMGVGMPASMLGPATAMSMLPHFSQVWTGQQYPGQPSSAAAMMGIAGHLAQGLYSNGYTGADGTVMGGAGAGSASLSASKQAMLSHEMYSRYSQSYH